MEEQVRQHNEKRAAAISESERAEESKNEHREVSETRISELEGRDLICFTK